MKQAKANGWCVQRRFDESFQHGHRMHRVRCLCHCVCIFSVSRLFDYIFSLSIVRVVYRVFILYLSFATFSLHFHTVFFLLSFSSSSPNRYTHINDGHTVIALEKKNADEKYCRIFYFTCGARLGRIVYTRRVLSHRILWAPNSAHIYIVV